MSADRVTESSLDTNILAQSEGHFPVRRLSASSLLSSESRLDPTSLPCPISAVLIEAQTRSLHPWEPGVLLLSSVSDSWPLEDTLRIPVLGTHNRVCTLSSRKAHVCAFPSAETSRAHLDRNVSHVNVSPVSTAVVIEDHNPAASCRDQLAAASISVSDPPRPSSERGRSPQRPILLQKSKEVYLPSHLNY